MMERLTVKWTDKVYDTLDPVDILDNEYSKINYNKLLTKLGEYEDLEDRLNGVSVKQVVDGFIKTVENQTNEEYEHGRILTNAEADEWNEYKQLDGQGLLLRLPTEAYFIKNNNVCKGWIQEVVYSVCRKLLLDIRYDDNSLDSYRGYLGNDVFFTQAEAEQKLEEMNTDNGITE